MRRGADGGADPGTTAHPRPPADCYANDYADPILR